MRGPARGLHKSVASPLGWGISLCTLHPISGKRLQTQSVCCRVPGLAFGLVGMAFRTAILLALFGALAVQALRPLDIDANKLTGEFLGSKKNTDGAKKERTNLRPIIGVVTEVGVGPQACWPAHPARCFLGHAMKAPCCP